MLSQPAHCTVLVPVPCSTVSTSVVYPKILNLDPDQGFWVNLDPGLCYQFGKKKLKIILEKKNFLTKKDFLNYSYKKQMSSKEIFCQLSLRIVNALFSPIPVFKYVDPDPYIRNTDLGPQSS